MIGMSKTKIANMALSHLGSTDTIQNIDTEKSAPAAAVRLWYDAARLCALEDADWSCARARQVLAAHSIDPPENRWAYRYVYPSDCVAPRYLENPALGSSVFSLYDASGNYSTSNDGNMVPFEIEQASDGSRSLVTDLAEAVLIYTRDEQRTYLFSANLVAAISYKLAHFIAKPVSEDDTSKTDMAKAYAAALLHAFANDANQQGQRMPRDADWIRGR